MESKYTELTCYGSKNECARTDTVFIPITEVRDGTVSLGNSFQYESAHLVRSNNLALLGILVQLGQKLNQNVSVKHSILKVNLIPNPTKYI